MNALNRRKVALVVGSFAAFVHIIWSTLVALNWGQPILNFVFGMHFIRNPYVVSPFSLITAIELVLLALIIGYIVGFVLSTIWNHFHRN
ncbi:MAG: hypothetical protein A2648_02075 [Candidatus Lloydbacteria bacterium RIFCSPHIGHO2_01_FULL_41_20]|uniref:Uncharacterized protein n=1 Tax=Candidatus Lloydbacteria bacterium RIFCSPHIGHO2_01_FULL_41_20 TaxID=1798657 RepID=A0A1G2CSJ3_9BACT|nr:MAG: hypothetical protein A2648_02075 [Candidatus Lloydbacteria bacterium RIFCSPHIGHO2_01_FULL_41_20]